MTETDLRLEYKHTTGTYPGNDEEKAWNNDFKNTPHTDMIDYIKWLENKICELNLKIKKDELRKRHGN